MDNKTSVMHHPKPEEWVPFLYGEANRDAGRELKAHLESCPECRAELERWRHGMRRLDKWRLPRSTAGAGWFVPAAKWAWTTALLLGLGCAVGRFTAPGTDAEELRARLEPQLRQTLQQEMAQLVREEVNRSAAAMLAAADAHTEKLLAAYDTVLETRRAEDLDRLYVVLKKQLDTVAINTEKEFLQLAGYVRPAGQSPSTPQ